MKLKKEKEVSIENRNDNYKMLSRLFFRLLPYQIVMIVITAVNGIVDGLFASNAVGTAAMSAMGLYTPIPHFLYAMSMIMVSGAQLLYGKYVVKEHDHIHSIFTVDLVLAGVISLIVGVLMAVGGAVCIGGGSLDPEAQAMFSRYLISNAIGIPPLILGQQLFAFLSLENRTTLTTAASIACLVTNALGDLLLTVAVPLDLLGLGLASAISCWVFFLVQLQYFVKGRSNVKFSLHSCKWRDAPQIIARGYPGGISRFLEMFRCIIVNALILRFVGAVGLSAFSASNSFLGIIWALPFGMAAVTRMLLSIAVGEEDRRSLIDTVRVPLRRGLALMIAVAACIIICAEPLTRMFYRDPSAPVYSMTVWGFRILPLCMPLSVIALTFSCYAQAAEKKLLSVVLPVIDGFVGVTGCSLILIPLLKMNGLYISNVLNGVICLLLIYGFAWKWNKHRPKDLEELMMIPDDFGPDTSDRIDISVRTMDDVVKVSEQVLAFCKEHGVDERRAYHSALALEEIAGNVVEHGFTKDRRKNHSAEIRVIRRDDDVILRVRDDCVPFDPTLTYGAYEEDDPAKNMGIRLIFITSKDVVYQNLLGCNVLTVTI